MTNHHPFFAPLLPPKGCCEKKTAAALQTTTRMSRIYYYDEARVELSFFFSAAFTKRRRKAVFGMFVVKAIFHLFKRGGKTKKQQQRRSKKTLSIIRRLAKAASKTTQDCSSQLCLCSQKRKPYVFSKKLFSQVFEMHHEHSSTFLTIVAKQASICKLCCCFEPGLRLFKKMQSRPRCLKIIGKVSFNIASEASYVYILSGQNLIKN